MPIDLLEPIANLGRKSEEPKQIWSGVRPGEGAFGRISSGNYEKMVKADNSWVYACARINAANVAKAKLRLFKRLGPDEREEIDDHIWLDLMRAVNPNDNEFDLKELTILFEMLVGNAYWYLMPSNLRGRNGAAIPGQIWPLLAQYVKVVPGVDRMVDGYLYRLPGAVKPIALAAEEVVHFKLPNPTDRLYGKGPLEAAGDTVTSNQAQKDYEISLFHNMGRPDAILNSTRDLTPDQTRQLRAEWKRNYGGTKKSGAVAVLHSGLTYQQISQSPRDLDFLRGRIATREEIAAIFGVPLSKLGIDVAADRAAAEAHDVTYQGETITPLLRRMQEKINERIMPIYDPTLEVRFDDPVPKNRELLLRERESRLNSYMTSINEERQKEGDEPAAWGESPIAPLAVGPLGSAPPPEEPAKTAPAAVVKSKEDRVKRWRKFVRLTTPIERALKVATERFFRKQRALVLANLNRTKGYAIKGDDDFIASILFPRAAENTRLAEVGRPHIEHGTVVGASLGLDDLDIDLDFDVLNPQVQEALKERVAFFSKRVNDETARQLIKQLTDGLAEAESITELSARIESVYRSAVGFRSRRIARTEVVSASNKGTLEVYTEGGVEKKAWLSAGDEATRDTHLGVESVAINSKFILPISGAALDHPGDPSAPAGEVINCRCSVAPEI